MFLCTALGNVDSILFRGCNRAPLTITRSKGLYTVVMLKKAQLAKYGMEHIILCVFECWPLSNTEMTHFTKFSGAHAEGAGCYFLCTPIQYSINIAIFTMIPASRELTSPRYSTNSLSKRSARRAMANIML